MADGAVNVGSEAVPDRFPASLAIAGGWGYIGRKFIGAARCLGLRLSVYDPGPPPRDLDLEGIAIADCETDFYAQQADLFHLALHPEQRRRGWDQLLARSLHEPICVLCEKPMAEPERPEHGPDICRQVAESGALVLYDFPELFDPITQRIREYLAGFRPRRSCRSTSSDPRTGKIRAMRETTSAWCQFSTRNPCIVWPLCWTCWGPCGEISRACLPMACR